jgi:thiol-disulfide isomerase/thioredoxin
MRLLCAAATALSLGLLVACADDKKPDPKPAAGDAAARLDKLKKKFDAEMADLKGRYEKASPADQRGILGERRELALISAQTAIEIAKEDPKGEVGLDAAVFAIEKAGRFGGGKEVEAATGIVAEHHLDSPKVKALLPVISGAGPAGEKFLRAAAEKAADKEVKGTALLYLGTIAAAQLDDEEDEKRVGELIAKATEYLEKAAKEAPEAKVEETTVAKAVAEQLEGLKAIKNLAVGKPVPDVEGTALDGKKVKLSGYKGKVVLVDIWATWCGPCVKMIPHERKMVEANQKRPFVLLSVSADNDQETLTKFLEKEPMPWDHWFDGRGGKVAKAFRVQAFPTLYLIDHAGVIRHKWVGNPGDEKLDKAVEELVKEAEKAKG